MSDDTDDTDADADTDTHTGDANTDNADADTDAGRVLYLNFSGDRPDKRADTADAKGTDDGWVGLERFMAYDHDFSGELLGHRYKLEERIGVGGVSTLYRAKDRRLGIMVAVKVLHPEHYQNADLMRRFTQEARVASQVRHPNLVPAVDFAGLGMRRFIVFELVKGRTVNDLMFEETFAWRRATEIICDLLAGLSAMHEAGVVHRDISPLNCLIDTANGGRGRLIDFGYVRVVDKRGDLDIAVLQTKSQMLYGTEGYIEPERLHGGPADERSDIFSIGAVWYAMVVGRPPLDPSSLDAAFTPIVLPLPMPEPLVAVVRGALAPRAERHASAAAMRDAIRHALELVDWARQQVRVPWWRRRAGVLGAALGGGVVAAALSLSLASADPRCPVPQQRVALQDVDRVTPPAPAPGPVSLAAALPQTAPVPVTPPVAASEAGGGGWQQQGSSVLASSSPPSPERSSTPQGKRAAPGPSSSLLRRALAACKPAGGGRLDVTVAPGERATVNDGQPRGELGRCIGDALAKHPPTRSETFKL